MFCYLNIQLPLLKIFKGDGNTIMFISYVLNKFQHIQDTSNETKELCGEGEWFWHTARQFQNGLCFTNDQIIRCRAKARKTKFYKEKTVVHPFKGNLCYFSIDEEELAKALKEANYTPERQKQEVLEGIIQENEKTIDEILEEKKKAKEEKSTEIDIKEVPSIIKDPSIWFEWTDYYKKVNKKRPISKKTLNMWLSDFEKGVKIGISPEEIINYSIAKGWKGFEYTVGTILKIRQNDLSFSNKNYDNNYKIQKQPFIHDYSKEERWGSK